MKRTHLAALALAAGATLAGWLTRRAEPGLTPDADFSPTSVAPLEALPEAPYPIEAPRPLAAGSAAGMVLMLFVDGMAEAAFRAELDAGALPNIQRLLDGRPAVLGEALATFPTSTAPSVPELLTGTWSHHQLGGPDKIHAFDRRGARLIRYEVEGRAWDASQPTLFDRVTAAGGTALSYFEGYFPGASLNVHDELVYLLDIAEDKVRAQRIGDYDAHMVRDFAARLEGAGRAPNLAFLRLGAVDTAGHFYGPSSPQYARAIESVDRRVGELLDQLELATLPGGGSLLERTHVLLFSDHGMSDTREHLDLDAVLSGLGFSPWATSDPAAVLATLVDEGAAQEHDAVAVPGGSNVSMIYLRPRVDGGLLPWSKLLSDPDYRAYPTASGEPADVVGALLAQEGVELVISLQGPHALRVDRRGGGATLLRRLSPAGGWRLAYLPDDAGADPFGYCTERPELCCPPGDAPAEGCFLEPERWLSATAEAALPAAPFFLFKASSGSPLTRQDLLVTAAPGWGFMEDMAGDHGALRPELLRVPLLISGPRVAAGGGPLDARLIDLSPTVLELLGLSPLPDTDGRVLPIFRP